MKLRLGVTSACIAILIFLSAMKPKNDSIYRTSDNINNVNNDWGEWINNDC